MSGFDDVVTVTTEGIRITVKAKPGSSRQRPPRLVDIGEGKRALEICVAAIAEDGKANLAVVEQLAKFFGVHKNALDIKSGVTGRIKIIDISGDPVTLQGKLCSLL